jgi:O-antigen/teichoic acid export membrane protein
MVWGFMIGRAANVVASYIARPHLPRLKLDWGKAVELHCYGKHIFRWVTLDYLVSQIDRILVGRLMGADALGLHSFAGLPAKLPATGLYRTLSGSAFRFSRPSRGSPPVFGAEWSGPSPCSRPSPHPPRRSSG